MPTFKNKKIIIEDKTYKLYEQIGSGGNGCVWAAKVLGEDNLYAIKFLESNSSKDKIERFKKEIVFCRVNEHRNIIKVFAEGIYKNRICYVMPQYVGTLRNILLEEKGYLELLNYIKQLCEAIKVAHDKGVIHRDIKPENVLIGKDGELVLADFGIAHFIDSTITETKAWLGNKSYAAPEQLIKESLYEITTACDIYALGKIINELFTKQNVGGTQYVTIADKHPILYRLDKLVHRCMLQNPNERPNIDEITVEVQLIEGQLRNSLDEVEECLLMDGIAGYSSTFIQSILPTACEDIIIAKYFFENKHEENLERLNPNYHRNIRYKIDDSLRNLYFQKLVLDLCETKFRYESRAYSRGEYYVSINLNNIDEYQLYQEFKKILSEYCLDYKFSDIIGRNLKLFASCCDYHCKELIDEVRRLIVTYETFDASPIFYIVLRLRHVLNDEEIQEIDLLDHISIDYSMTTEYENEENEVFMTTEYEEEKILSQMQEKWNVTISKVDSKHFSVIFDNKEKYIKFKAYALNLAKGHYVFEGDVLEMIQINREYAGIIEMGPLNSFDITSTISKVLGLRHDY